MSCFRAFAKGEQNKGSSKNPAGAKRYFWDTKISPLSALQILKLPTRQASSSKGCKAIYQTSISEGINTWADAKKMLKRQSGWAKRHRGRAGEACRRQRDSQRYKERPDGTESVRRCLYERVGGESDSAETLSRDTQQRHSAESLLDETGETDSSTPSLSCCSCYQCDSCCTASYTSNHCKHQWFIAALSKRASKQAWWWRCSNVTSTESVFFFLSFFSC